MNDNNKGVLCIYKAPVLLEPRHQVNIIFRTLVRGVLPLDRDAVGVFYSHSRLAQAKIELDELPTMGETTKAIWQQMSRKAAENNIQPEIWKHGELALRKKFHELFAGSLINHRKMSATQSSLPYIDWCLSIRPAPTIHPIWERWRLETYYRPCCLLWKHPQGRSQGQKTLEEGLHHYAIKAWPNLQL